MKKYIAEGWEGFTEAVFQDTNIRPGDIQYVEMRRAFYAGAMSVVGSIMQATVGTTDEEDNAVGDALQAEMKEWEARLERGEV